MTNGTFTTYAAAQLKGKKSMMNKSGGKTTTGHIGHLEMNSYSKQDNKSLEVSEQFQGQLKDFVDDYISLKNALVLGENNNVHRISKELLVTFADVNMKSLTDVQSPFRMDGHSEAIKRGNQYFGKVMLNCGNTVSEINKIYN